MGTVTMDTVEKQENKHALDWIAELLFTKLPKPAWEQLRAALRQPLPDATRDRVVRLLMVFVLKDIREYAFPDARGFIDGVIGLYDRMIAGEPITAEERESGGRACSDAVFAARAYPDPKFNGALEAARAGEAALFCMPCPGYIHQPRSAADVLDAAAWAVYRGSHPPDSDDLTPLHDAFDYYATELLRLLREAGVGLESHAARQPHKPSGDTVQRVRVLLHMFVRGSDAQEIMETAFKYLHRPGLYDASGGIVEAEPRHAGQSFTIIEPGGGVSESVPVPQSNITGVSQ